MVSLYSYCFFFFFHYGLTRLWVYQRAFRKTLQKSLFLYTHLTKDNSFHIDDIKLHDFKSKDISIGYLRYMDI